MGTPPPITRMTSKQAKKAYKKRGGQPQLTDLQKRQIARSVELDRRAQAIREKEQRKKDNARKRAEKEEKHRETRRKMGIAEPVDEGYVSPRQTRMDGFFRRPTINTSLAAAVKETTDNEAQTDEPDSDDAASIQEKLHADGQDLEDLLSSDDEVDVNGSDAEIDTVEDNRVDGQEDHTAKEPALQGTTLEPIRIKRKREALSRASSGISCYSQPVRMPLRLMDPNLFIDKRELWVPPSQNVIGQGKHAVMAPLRNEPFPDLPFPQPESTDRPVSPDNEASASQHEYSQNASIAERATPKVPLLEEDVPLPSMSKNEVKAGSVDDMDKEILELAALFSSDSHFDIDELPLQALPTKNVPLTEIHQNSVTRDEEGQFNVDDMLAGLSASQFSSPLDLYHPSEPPLPVVRLTETVTEQGHEEDIPDSDMMPLTDALDISIEDAEALEHAAMRILNKQDELATPRERKDASAQQIATEAGEQLPTRQTESKPEQHQGVDVSRSANPAEKPNALSTSFGFGDFDFSSQDIDRFQK